jgi:uncharacterized cupin superfamily protein
VPDFTYSKSSVELNPAPIDPTWILDGTPVARYAELSRSADGTASTVLWDCTPGEFEWRYDIDETMQILDGIALLDPGRASERRVRQGDIVFFPAGSRVRWKVEHHVRKIAFMRRPLPGPLRGLLMLMRMTKASMKKFQGQKDENPLT